MHLFIITESIDSILILLNGLSLSNYVVLTTASISCNPDVACIGARGVCPSKPQGGGNWEEHSQLLFDDDNSTLNSYSTHGNTAVLLEAVCVNKINKIINIIL